MNISLGDVLTVSLFFAVLWYWWQSMGMRDRALRFVRRHCDERGYQLLDESLAFRGWRLLRDRYQRRLLCRLYCFDVSTDGTDRISGDIALSRQHVVRVVIDSEHREISDFN